MSINMLAELAAPIIFIVLFIISVCVGIAISIREEKSTITNEREKDFIDRWADKKRRQLRSIPGAISFKVYVMIMVVSPILIGGALFIFMKSTVMTAIGICAGLVIPELIIKIKKSQNDKDFDERYGRALKQMASTLRSGMTIQQAVEDVSQNPFLDKFTKDMFTQINSDIRVGIPIADAFMRATEIKSTCDTRDMAAAMAMQAEVGGSEAEVVEIVSNNINKRIMLRKEIRTLFTTSKITVYAMDVAPPIMLLFLVMNGGDMTAFYFESPLNTLFLLAFFGVFGIGSIVSHKMMNQSKVGSD